MWSFATIKLYLTMRPETTQWGSARRDMYVTIDGIDVNLAPENYKTFLKKTNGDLLALTTFRQREAKTAIRDGLEINYEDDWRYTLSAGLEIVKHNAGNSGLEEVTVVHAEEYPADLPSGSWWGGIWGKREDTRASFARIRAASNDLTDFMTAETKLSPPLTLHSWSLPYGTPGVVCSATEPSFCEVNFAQELSHKLRKL